MPAEFAIRAEGLSKQYRLGQRSDAYDTLREQIVRWGRSISGANGKRREPETIWALRDLSFEVEQGEIVGIIGRNGAGKTTLLKLLSRITEPTDGYADVRGRLGSLLEVGTGFHPELTGRENIFLNGSILGMRRSEVARKLEEIVDFAGVEKFLETPVKRFSTGMYVRLAFSVAAHLEPEILVVDEVLAVGDLEFQRKCLGRMESIGRSGRSVLFVSHSMPAVTRLCERVILLDEGRIVMDGPSEDVTAHYLHSDTGTAARREWPDPSTAPGDDLVRLRSVRVVNPELESAHTVDVREPTGIELTFDVLREGPPIRPQMKLVNEQGVHAFNAIDTAPRWREPAEVGSYVSTAWIPANLLNEGLMTVTVFVSTLAPQKTIQHVLERDVVAFHVTDPVEGDSAKGDYTGQWHGAVRPLLSWSVERD